MILILIISALSASTVAVLWRAGRREQRIRRNMRRFAELLKSLNHDFRPEIEAALAAHERSRMERSGRSVCGGVR